MRKIITSLLACCVVAVMSCKESEKPHVDIHKCGNKEEALNIVRGLSHGEEFEYLGIYTINKDLCAYIFKPRENGKEDDKQIPVFYTNGIYIVGLVFNEDGAFINPIKSQEGAK